ncbi:hypothetical protein [Mesorhizobium sp. SP-1A]|uniref:hypothetical protein n=1 Tax=Mesorhizobium sp. SP-1A TaxID=3077840 RepID=UPI0028F74A0E|nr:hypothetical protein [Mesorhizobium sp. SP-1A]
MIYDSNTGAVALSPAEAAANVVRQGRNEAAVALRKEAERFGDEIEYVVYLGNRTYKELERSSVTTLWKEFLKEPLPCIAGAWSLFMGLSLILIVWVAAIIGHPTKGTLSPWIAAAATAFVLGLARFLWKELKNDLSSVSHIKKFGFKKDFLPTARRYSRNMIGVGRDSLYVFAAPMSEDMTVNKIGYDQIQHVRDQNGMLNIVSRGGQVIETVYNYESEYKGDVVSDIMNRHLEATK